MQEVKKICVEYHYISMVPVILFACAVFANTACPTHMHVLQYSVLYVNDYAHKIITARYGTYICMHAFLSHPDHLTYTVNLLFLLFLDV